MSKPGARKTATGPSRTEPSRAGSSRAEPSQTVPSRAEPHTAAAYEADMFGTNPFETDPSRAVPSWAVPSWADPSRTDPLRPVELLVGMRAIANFLRVSTRAVREMSDAGAPIFRDYLGVLRAEKTELWQWFRSPQREAFEQVMREKYPGGQRKSDSFDEEA